MLPVPAIGTELTGRDSHRFHQIIQTVVAECGKIQPFADFFDHFRIILAVRVCIAVKDLLRYIVSLTVADDPSGDQIQFRGRTGESSNTGSQRAAAGRQDGYVPLCSALVEKFCGFS